MMEPRRHSMATTACGTREACCCSVQQLLSLLLQAGSRQIYVKLVVQGCRNGCWSVTAKLGASVSQTSMCNRVFQKQSAE